MGNNNLYKVENTLRSMAKRYKSVKYSLGLAILFLMMGVNAFSEEIVAQEAMTNEEIALSKENLKDSVSNLQSKIDSAKKENEKALTGLKLELVQLMEQGNQVVKSPWMSWQFGANYMYNKWNGTYKGRGDKAEKYPYEGIFVRSNNIYERYISPLSKAYSSLSTSSDLRAASTNNRNGLLNGYGLITVEGLQEPIVGFDVSAGVRPKQVQKGTINIADKNPIAPEQPKAISFSAPVINVNPPAAPVINAAVPQVTIPTVIAPTVTEPNLPPTISFVVASPTITLPNLTPPTVSFPNPPGTGNGDDMYIQDGNGAALIGTLSNENVGMISQQTINQKVSGVRGNLNVTVNAGTTMDIGWSGIEFEGNKGASHLTGTKYSTDRNTTGYSGFSAMKLVGGHEIQINGTDINFSGTGPNSYRKWLFHTDGHNNYGDSTWVIGSDSTVNINGSNLIMYTAQYHGSAPTRGSVGMLNKGNITTTNTGSDTKNFIWYAMSAGSWGGDRVMFFNNAGNITLNGKADVFAAVNSESSGSFSIINDGSIKLAGENQAGIAFGQSYTKGEILLNKPITITGKGSTGVYLAHSVDLDGGETRGVSTAGNQVTTFPTTTRESILNVDITSGTKNSGLFFDADGKIFNIANSTIQLSSADGNNAGIFLQKGILNIKNGKNGTAYKNNVNLTGGKENVGIYVDNSGVAGNKVAKLVAEGAINITGGTQGIGILSVGNPTDNNVDVTNKGEIRIKADTNANPNNTADGNTAMVASLNKAGTSKGEIKQEGKIYINAKNSIGVAAVGLGAKAYINNGSETYAGETTDKAGVAAGSSALYAEKDGQVYSVGGAKIFSANGGVGAYASGATNGGTIDFNGSTITTNARGLTFMADGKGKIKFSGTTTGDIKDYGTVFYLSPVNKVTSPTATNFNTTASILPAFKNMVETHFSNLNNLNLNMTSKSNMVVTSYVAGNVSSLTFNESTAFGTAGVPNITGDYKAFLLDKSKITVDVDSNLDSTSTGTAAAFRRIALASSTIINNKNITGTQANLVAMAQEDTSTDGWVDLQNTKNASISLTGQGSVAIYASNGKITNDGSITVGDKGVAIYGHNNGYGDTTISNTGTIKVGSQSTGIYAKDYISKDVKNSATGKIEIAGSKSSGMAFVPKNLTATTTVFENEGKITDNNSGSNNTGMFAKVAANNNLYTTKNSGTITLGNSSALTNPSVGMYTNATSVGTNPLINTGKITVGNNGIGMYGFEETTTGDVTVGDGGIALYSQGGAVNIGSTGKNITVKVGASKATAVFTTGNGQTVTSTNTTYDIGNNSYGFVNTGTGNTINITGGKATLVDNGVFIYSKTGTITSTAPITATGTTGSNYAIYAGGTVTNSGNITMTGGTGNVGIYATNNGTITNSGDIKLGASTQNKRSIGLISNVGTITNSGNITVNGAYGLGIYATGAASTVTSSKNITLIGDEVIAAFGTNNSNINLTSGTVTLTGNKSTGYYLNGGTASSILSPTKINITGNESNGVYVNNGASLTYSGDTKVVGDAAYGLIVDNTSTVNTTGGTLTVSGTGTNPSKTNANRGSAALVVTKNSTLGGGKLDVTANVSGKNSVGIYSAGNLTIDSANISAYDSA